MRARLIKEIGTRASLRVYWGDKECPNCLGGGSAGYHNAEIPLGRTEAVGAWDFGGKPEDYPDERWPAKCDHCGAPVQGDAPERRYGKDGTNGGLTRQVHRDRLYDTPSGKPEPGSIFEAHWYPENFMFDGVTRHLVCVLPNGNHWHMTGRASNCTRPDDREHRCWVIHEEAPGVFHVDKNGDTCAAGGGSIATPGFHGFLHHGELVQC
jgi:hypothetical protein